MLRKMVVLALFVPVMAVAQTGGEGKAYPDAAGCIGGEKCGSDQEIRVPLENRPVLGVRFFAGDDIGSSAKGRLRVRIDDTVLEEDLDIPRSGKVFFLEVENLRGRTLVFEPASDDEVRIRNVEVVYARTLAWKDYSNFDSCVGGNRCRQKWIRIPLESKAVLGIRFHARDDIGSSSNGELRIRIDDRVIQSGIDVKRQGKNYEFSVESVVGRELVIEPTSDDEVSIEAIEIRYGEGSRIIRLPGPGGPSGLPPVTDRGGCIGGEKCGGPSRKIRVELENRPVRSIQFRAHDNVGSEAEGTLRVRIDDNVIEEDIDIPRSGKTFKLDGGGVRGRRLILEAGDDEVVVEDLEVRYGR